MSLFGKRAKFIKIGEFHINPYFIKKIFFSKESSEKTKEFGVDGPFLLIDLSNGEFMEFKNEEAIAGANALRLDEE